MYIASPAIFFTLPSLIFSSSSTPTSTISVDQDTSCTYAPREHIQSLFTELTSGNSTVFYDQVVDDVDWNVQGTHPLAGRYHNKTVFLINAVNRIAKLQDANRPHAAKLLNIVGGCNEEWSAQEIRVTAYMSNGMWQSSSLVLYNTLWINFA